MGVFGDEEYIDETGFIAQDIQQIDGLQQFVMEDVNPEMYENDTGSQFYLTYNGIFVMTTQAVKELDTIVQNQQTNINELNTKIQNLENENLLIKTALNELLSEAGKSTI